MRYYPSSFATEYTHTHSRVTIIYRQSSSYLYTLSFIKISQQSFVITLENVNQFHW